MQGSLMLDIEGLWLTAEDRHILRQPEVAGVILFARNVEHPRQVAELSRSIKAVREDLLIAVDQEGGRVQRLHRGFTVLPSMRTIAQSADPEKNAGLCGWLMAAEVLAAGIDFSFAPVLDLDYAHNAVIGSRSFSQQPATVIALARAFIKGMSSVGMANVGKHFPGHGWVSIDSHEATPVDERSFAAIEQSDLHVFIQLAGELNAIMPAHVVYPQVDALPAGFSRHWLQQVLREQLGFNGLLFSDDLCMAGAHVVGDIAQRTGAALEAGCDVALVCNDRAAAEHALQWFQTIKVQPCARLALMQGRNRLPGDLQQQPQYQSVHQRVRALTATQE